LKGKKKGQLMRGWDSLLLSVPFLDERGKGKKERERGIKRVTKIPAGWEKKKKGNGKASLRS